MLTAGYPLPVSCFASYFDTNDRAL